MPVAGPGVRMGLVLWIGSPFRVLRDRRERPRERCHDDRDHLLKLGAKRRCLPPTCVGGYVEAPQVDGVAAQSKVLDRISGGAGLDDHRGAVLTRA